jgi:predicted metal-dependent phosphoesterase TrpH
LTHPEIEDMKKSEQLQFFMDNGALVIQAHPFREAGYIDHIRLFPRNVHGVEIINAGNSDKVNEMAKRYASYYDLVEFAGSDKHGTKKAGRLAGVCSDTPVFSEKEFVERVKNREMSIFEYKFED